MGSDYFQEYDDCGYGLRKNPKKTLRFTVSDQEQSNDDIETRILTRCQFKRQRDECMSHDKQAGFDPFCPVRKKRSKLERKVSWSFSFSGFGSVSRFSEFNEEEEVALSMMMLSSGITNWGEFISDFDSSGKDVLISKAKALNGIEKELNVESDEAGCDIKHLEASLGDHDTEAGVVLKKIDSSFGDFVSGNASFEKPDTGDDFDINFSYSGIERGEKFKKSEETSCDDAEPGGLAGKQIDGCVGKGIDGSVGMEIDCFGTKIDGSLGTKTDDSVGMENNGSVGVKIGDFVGTKIDVSLGVSGMEIDGSVSEISENKPEFKCKTYKRRFPSFQALGDDQTTKCDRKADAMENCYKQKKNKYIHECSICFKVFPSGQALGGHKRAHFDGFSENKNKERFFKCQESVAVGFGGFPFGRQIDSGLGLKLWDVV